MRSSLLGASVFACAVLTVACSGNPTSDDPPGADGSNGVEIPVHLADSDVGSRSCISIVTDEDAELFAGIFTVWHDQPVPGDLRYTGIVAESRLGYEFSPVLLTHSEGIPPDAVVINDPFWKDLLTSEPLPASPTTDRYAIGALVDVPRDGDETPNDVALIITGLTYVLDGVEHTRKVNHAVWISRLQADDSDFCAGVDERMDAINEEFGFL